MLPLMEELAFRASSRPMMVHAAVPTDVPAGTLQDPLI